LGLPRTDLIDVITAPVAVTAYRYRWIVPAVALTAVASWFAVLVAILAATH
jgi:hypothetical protein